MSREVYSFDDPRHMTVMNLQRQGVLVLSAFCLLYQYVNETSGQSPPDQVYKEPSGIPSRR